MTEGSLLVLLVVLPQTTVRGLDAVSWCGSVPGFHQLKPGCRQLPTYLQMLPAFVGTN